MPLPVSSNANLSKTLRSQAEPLDGASAGATYLGVLNDTDLSGQSFAASFGFGLQVLDTSPAAAPLPVATVAALVSTTPVSAASATVSTPPTSGTGTGIVKSVATPSWVSGLTTASIRNDMTAADVNGTVTYAGLTTLLNDVNASLASSGGKLTAAQFADLKTIAANLNTGMTTSTYLVGIFGALVNGSALNATWTGGAASSVALGNLAAGSTSTQLTELIGKWFMGTDLPSSAVSMSGSAPFTVSYSTVSAPLFGASGPSMNDVNQGYLGDCYLLSSLAEVAKQNSGLISSMFTNNGNGTYGVRFFVNGAADYVTVNACLAGGGTEFNSGADLWASLAEKAYAQLQAGGVETGNTAVNFGNSWSTIGNGGAPAYALEEITGATAITQFQASRGSWYAYVMNASLQTTSYTPGVSSANVLSTLVSDLAKGDDVILSSYTDARDSAGRTTLVSSHAMSIYGYDTATGMLQVRNPWGSEPGQYWDTTFEVSLSTLLTAGDVITVDNVGGTGTTTPASPPVLVSQTGTQTWKLGQAVSFALPTGTFKDPQGQALTYAATLASGAALPTWLTFNTATGTFAGTVPNTVTGLSIKVTATDTSGLSATEAFSVLTPATAPTLASQTATQTWKLGQAVTFAIPAGTFSDPQGETLTYKATLANGAALPSWLTFNTTTGAFTGTVPNTTAGLSIKVTATDTSGLSASETFSVLTPATAPIVATQTATQTWKLGQVVSYAIPAGTFSDPQGETLTYKATLASGAALPTWLTFNTTTGTFYGTVPNTAAGLSIKVTATDTSGLSASETFSVLTPATAPMLVSQTAAQTWAAGKAFTLALPTTTFTDPQKETLTYTATQANGSALPTWLKFTAATETFSGTAPTTAAALSIKVTATDTSGLTASETFSASVAAAAASMVAGISSLPSGGSSVTAALTHLAANQAQTLASPAH